MAIGADGAWLSVLHLCVHMCVCICICIFTLAFAQLSGSPGAGHHLGKYSMGTNTSTPKDEGISVWFMLKLYLMFLLLLHHGEQNHQLVHFVMRRRCSLLSQDASNQSLSLKMTKESLFEFRTFAFLGLCWMRN